MAGGVTITFDTREFDRTLREYQDLTRKDFDEIVLNKAYDLAGGFGKGALQHTKKASADKIRQQLSAAVGTRVVRGRRGTTKGKLKAGGRYISFGTTDDEIKATLSARIVNKRLIDAGQKPIWGSALAKAAKKLTMARVRSVSFVAAGWLGSIQKLAPFVGKGTPGGKDGVRSRNPKGTASVTKSTFSLNPSATIVNTAMNVKHGDNRGASEAATTGLQRAFQIITADMAHYIEQKLQKTADKVSAK